SSARAANAPASATVPACVPVLPCGIVKNPFRHRDQAPVGLITITVMLGLIMAIIDTTIVNVALNTIGGNLGATVDEVAWVATGYILANVCVMPLNGYL